MEKVNSWKRHLRPNRKIRFRTSGKERKKCSAKCWNISRKRHPVPVSLSNSAIWTTLCSVTVLSGTTTIFRSTGYGYAIRYIVRKSGRPFQPVTSPPDKKGLKNGAKVEEAHTTDEIRDFHVCCIRFTLPAYAGISLPMTFPPHEQYAHQGKAS